MHLVLNLKYGESEYEYAQDHPAISNLAEHKKRLSEKQTKYTK